MAWEENSRICLHMQLIAILSRIGVVFSNGQIVDGDTIHLYYGASDEVICLADLSIQKVLNSLKS